RRQCQIFLFLGQLRMGSAGDENVFDLGDGSLDGTLLVEQLLVTEVSLQHNADLLRRNDKSILAAVDSSLQSLLFSIKLNQLALKLHKVALVLAYHLDVEFLLYGACLRSIEQGRARDNSGNQITTVFQGLRIFRIDLV